MCWNISFITLMGIIWLNTSYGMTISDQKDTFDIRENFVRPEEQIYRSNVANCCIVPTCNNIECYDVVRCDQVCSEGNYRPVPNSPTRSYRLKTFYEKFECHFGECKNYRFLCNHCPDPRLQDFNIVTLRKDCINCYH